MPAEIQVPDAVFAIGSNRFAFPLPPALVGELRRLVTEHGDNELVHLGWAVAVQIHSAVSEGYADVHPSDLVGTIEIVGGFVVPVRAGGWMDVCLARCEADGFNIVDVLVRGAEHTLKIVLGLPDGLPFGPRAPSDKQMFRIRRMMAAGMPVPNVQSRISLPAASEYIGRYNDAYLARSGEAGDHWLMMKAAGHLGVTAVRLRWWLIRNAYLDEDGDSTPLGDTLTVKEIKYWTDKPTVQLRWNAKFIEGLVARSSEIAAATNPAKPDRPAKAKRRSMADPLNDTNGG